MELTDSLLETIRDSLGLGKDVADFDTEVLMHTNASLAILHQNGIIKPTVVTGIETTWLDLQDPLAVEGNDAFMMVPLFVMLSTKQLFDPPPPSTVELYSRQIEQILWRLRTAYELVTVTTTTVEN